MEIVRPWQAVSGIAPAHPDRALRAASRDLAETELRAAIGLVGRDPAYTVCVCCAATDARLVAGLDALASSCGVVLERRIRPGGGLDVSVRSA